MSRTFDRRTPPDFTHVEKYPLTAITAPKGVPVVLGINWYSNFDEPVLDGRRWYIGRGDLGSIRGGHCVCIKPGELLDYPAWQAFYNQGQEGACVGFGSSRAMSLMNRRRYDARWLWNEAKKIDPWPDTNPGDDNGTDVNSAMKVLRDQGALRWQGYAPDKREGISSYRWATTAQQVIDVVAYPLGEKLGAVPILNSWGMDYPHVVWMPLETLDRLLDEGGEAAIPTDR